MKRAWLIAAALLFWAGAVSAQMLLLGVGGGGVAPSNLITPIMASTFAPASGTTTQFGATTATTTNGVNSYSTSSTTRRVPLPFAGTIANLRAHLGAANAGVTITNQLGSAGLGTVTCNFSGGANTDCTSGTTQTVAAGSLFQWQLATTSAWAAQAIQLGFTYTASNGQHAAILGQAGASGASTAAVFYAINGSTNNATETNVTSIFCQVACGGTIHGFYWIPNGTETAGAAHALAISINGTPSAVMTCAEALGAATGCCVNDRASAGTIDGTTACTTVAPITVNPGDSISIKTSCSTGTCTASIFPGFGIDFTPTTTNVVPVLTASLGLAGPDWIGLSDYGFSASQNNYQMAPVNMTVSNYGFCGLAAFTGTATLTAVAQSGSTGTAPTTPGSAPTNTLSVSSTACTGASSGTYLSGSFDNTHTLSLTAGQTTDVTITRAGSVNVTPMKYSAAIIASAAVASPSFNALIDLPMSPPGPAFLP